MGQDAGRKESQAWVKMKLLVITASYPPHQIGGYEIRCKDVVDSLVKRGHDVLILTSQCPIPKCETHSNEHSIKRFLHQKDEAQNIFIQIHNDIKDLKFIEQKTKGFRPDIVYLWGIQPLSNAILPYFSYRKIQIVYDEGGSGLISLVKIQKRGIYFFRDERDPFYKKIVKKVIDLMANLFSLNLIKPRWSWPPNMRAYFNCYSSLKYSQKAGVPVDNARVIYSGIEISKFPYLLRDKISVPIKIIMPGRIKQIKGTKDGVDFVKELTKRNLKVKLRLVGKIQSEDYFKEILETINEYKLNEVVEYLPMVSRTELACLYRQSDFCFFSSYLKPGFSRVPLEAMASGCLVISYGNEGSGEVIQDKETGFIVSEGDIYAAADLVESMIKSPAKYLEISRRARLKIEKEHSIDKYVDSIEAYLHESLVEYGK